MGKTSNIFVLCMTIFINFSTVYILPQYNGCVCLPMFLAFCDWPHYIFSSVNIYERFQMLLANLVMYCGVEIIRLQPT